MRRIGIVGAAFAAVVLMGVPRPAAAGHPKEKLMWEAAQALYGKGLSIKRTKRATTIRLGKLTQRRWDTYVKEVYLPNLAQTTASVTLGRRFRKEYKDPKWDLRAPVKRAHILFETQIKHALCKGIVFQIWLSDQSAIKTRFQREAWCAYQAILEAYAPIYEFRGKTVTWKAAERSTAPLDTEIFKAGADGHYPIFITVAGGSDIVTQEAQGIATSLLGNSWTFADALYAKAKRFTETKYKAFRKREVKALARQKRAMGGRWAIFGEQRFQSWEVHRPAKGPIACAGASFLFYTPKRAKMYDVAFNVDGTQCESMYLASGRRHESPFFHMSSCNSMIKTGATHKLEIVFYKLILLGKWSRREWNKNEQRYVTVTGHHKRRGKKLRSESITCTNK